MQKKYLKAAVLLLSPSFLCAQFDRMPYKEGYLKPLPNVSWANDQQYRQIITENGKSKTLYFDIRTGKEVPAPAPSGQTAGRIKSAGVQGMENPVFSPDTTMQAFTRNNDLYVKQLATGKEWRVTHDGSEHVYSGKSSWVYNEEILGRGMKYRAFWWSPNSKHIVFMRSDETNVPVHILYDDAGQHGKYTSIHYPKAGDANPEVRIGIADISNESITWAAFDPKADQYFGAPIWRPDSKAVWIQWMNRRQDSLKIEEVDLQSGSRKNIYTETQPTWINLDEENRVYFLPSKNIFLLMSDKSGWKHLYAYTMEGKLIKQITSGNWAIDEINLIDEKNSTIFFSARKENSLRNDFYRVGIDGKGFRRLTFGEYTHKINLSPDGAYFFTTYANNSTPSRIALMDKHGKLIRELADEKGPRFDAFKADKYEFFRVPTADGFELPVRVMWPSDMDPNKKYPVLVNIYGGPARMDVRDAYLGAYTDDQRKNEVIRVSIDHRGSAHFGKAGQNWLYGKLGKYEIEDYCTAMRWLWKQFPAIDSTRIGITGFSYGGYLSALAVTKGADVFTYAIAGGSVTDWMLYDTHYTERYMGHPKDNAAGYKEAAVMTYVDRYKGMMKLTQGSVDDNVHMQNTLQLVNALQNAGKKFELMIYPGAAHGWMFDRAKSAHSRNADMEFIGQYLLGKPAPLMNQSPTKQ